MKVVICGAGPVGALSAIYAATRGHDVEIYELRGERIFDGMEATQLPGTSISLTMSDRGFEALRASGDAELVGDVVQGTQAVHAREVHQSSSLSCQDRSIRMRYDAGGKHLNVVGRDKLRGILLERLHKLPNVKVFFDSKLIHADLHARFAVFSDARVKETWGSDQTYKRVGFDLLIGADGAHSAVRHQMARYAHINLARTWLDTWWCEFHIAAPRPGIQSRAKMASDALHVWPEHSSMFLAVPNRDGSFACNLFAPHAVFDELSERASTNKDAAAVEAALQEFFGRQFPGVVPELMTASELREQFLRASPSPLHDVRVSRVSHSDCCVLVGDAAHAMVPFYGQGLNVGLEDVRILFNEYLCPPAAEGLAEQGGGGGSRSQRLSAYSARRQPEVAVMATLALQNYGEMRHAHRATLAKRARRTVEECLQLWLPAADWRTLYARVAFSTENFVEIERKNARQGLILTVLALVLVLALMMVMARLMICCYA